MKRLSLLVFVLLCAMLPAVGQLRMGLAGGVTTNRLRLNRDLFSSEHRVGWTAGVKLELRLPLPGLCVDGALMYTHRSVRLEDETTRYNRNFLEVPLHLRYGLQIVGVGRIVTPYVFTGPNLGLLCSNSASADWKNRTTNWSWDAGFGVELFGHWQLSATYGLGLSKALRQVGVDSDGGSVAGRDRFWTLTAAYVF